MLQMNESLVPFLYPGKTLLIDHDPVPESPRSLLTILSPQQSRQPLPIDHGRDERVYLCYPLNYSNSIMTRVEAGPARMSTHVSIRKLSAEPRDTLSLSALC